MNGSVCRIRYFYIVGWVLLFCGFAFGGLYASAREELAPFYVNDGLVGLMRRLKRVESGVRVLHVAAHPDDEDSALLAWLSLGQGARVTYLSLTRGEGGQNLIGPEQGSALGVLRTAELLAARRLDGAGQIFGRMIDFGFSKSPEECFDKWGRDNVVEDIVRAIRITRPHIIICRFQGTAQDGHGQHQASAIAAREAFDKAANPHYRPRMFEEGLTPWQAQKFYVGSFDPDEADAVRIDTGDYDAMAGRSFAATGYRGRSQHRSQDMGMIEHETPMRDSAYRLERATWKTLPKTAGLFEGLDLEHEGLRKRVSEIYGSAGFVADSSRFAPQIATLLARWQAEAPEDLEAIRDLRHALSISLGLRLEAISKQGHLHPGGSGEIYCNAFVPYPEMIADPAWKLRDASNVKTQVDPKASNAEDEQAVRNANYQKRFVVAEVGPAPKLPYFLRIPSKGWLYDCPEEMNAILPFDPPALSAEFSFAFGNLRVRLEIPVERRIADPAFGEIREDLRVLPKLSGGFEKDVLIVNKQLKKPARSMVRARICPTEGFDGHLGLYLDEQMLGTQSLARVGSQEHSVVFDLAKLDDKEGLLSSVSRLTLIAEEHDREIEMHGAVPYVRYLNYRHIRPNYLVQPAVCNLHVVDVKLPHEIRVAYVPGAEDAVPSVLADLGLNLVMLHEGDLTSADLDAFDTIVLGARAYEVRPDLAPNNAALHAYVERGGTLIVQYNKHEFSDNDLAPLRLKIRRPHDRVTYEDAPVAMLRPEHPVFNKPNKILPSDFDGWVQERGLYFSSEWDSQYEPLLSCADPGEPQLRGGMLYLRWGRGHYIYTGFSFFRQLPAGHEGAMKLFVNMIALGASEDHPTPK